MTTRTILIILGLVAVLGGAIGYRMFAERPAQAADRTVELAVTASTLFNAFVQDETVAGKVYNDKVVEVIGVVRDVKIDADNNVDVLVETGDPIGAVVCEFAAGEKVAAMKGDSVRIKGFCAGYNLDVLLQRCSITH
ncbi:MAG: OB-fold protein [Flavobacteriales bacterium]